MSFLKRAGAFLKGPKFSNGTLVTYQRVTNRVESVAFEEGAYTYRLCGYFTDFSESDIERFRQVYLAAHLPKAAK